MDSKIELVNHPNHYQSCAIDTRHIVELLGVARNYLEEECIIAIENTYHLRTSFHLGNAVKYLWRYGQKSKEQSLQDLQKARWYVARHQERYLPATFRDALVIEAIDKLILKHTGE